ncbi:MAG: DUF892 family protein, partial [Polaromonas sp.]
MALKPSTAAEKLQPKALPKTAHAAFHRELSAALASHLEKTVDLLERLDRIVEKCGNKLKRMKCDAMDGPRKEVQVLIAEGTESPVRGAALVSLAHKVKHYETSIYGTLAAFASHLDLPQAVELLKKTLEEEQANDRKLAKLAEENAGPEAEPTPGEAA